MRGLSLVAASGGHSSSWCAALSLSRPLLLRHTGSRRAGSVVVAHGPSCSAACGIFPDQGSNPCLLHWQADSQPLRHQGSPVTMFLNVHIFCFCFLVLIFRELPKLLSPKFLIGSLRNYLFNFHEQLLFSNSFFRLSYCLVDHFSLNISGYTSLRVLPKN